MESFEQLFESSLVESPILSGAIITATVLHIDSKYVVVDAGLKSESYIPLEQFYYENRNLSVQVGDETEVALEVMEDGFGSTRLSRERAKRLESWTRLARAHENNETVHGTIVGRVKGGFTVDINKVKAFLPGSLVDFKPIRDPDSLEGKSFDFKVIKVDQKRNNIVVSRRAVLEAETHVERSAVLENIHEGDEITGTVKNLTDYGAFVDLGGIDGLLHITDMSWKRTRHPSEILKLGDEVKVKVLKVDRDHARVSLGLKHLVGDPWRDIGDRYLVKSKITGRVTNITEYGCFVEIESGIEGLVHVSEMDWTNKNVNPNKVLHLGQEVEVMVLDVDADRRRISLGLKQCIVNPWAAFAEHHHDGEKIKGKIKSITDFGIFIELDGGIDGLIYLSDIAWNEKEAEEKLRQYQKGDELEALVLTIDVERERIALGLKQLTDDPVAHYLQNNKKGNIVSGKVVELNQKQLIIELATDVLGVIRATDVTASWKVDDAVDVKVVGADKKMHMVALVSSAEDVTDDIEDHHAAAKDEKTSTKKAKSSKPSSASQDAGSVPRSGGAKKKPATSSSSSALKTTLGDILKGQMDKGE